MSACRLPVEFSGFHGRIKVLRQIRDQHLRNLADFSKPLIVLGRRDPTLR